jgi:anti-anti-sigma regulatory factor
MMMEMTVSEHKGEKTVTILHIDGYLDGSNYTQLIDKAQELFSTGTENLLLDMEKCRFISSAGLKAFYGVAMIMCGDDPPDTSQAWATFSEIRDKIQKETGTCCKILNLQPKAKQSLEITGMLKSLDIYDDLETALASF